MSLTHRLRNFLTYIETFVSKQKPKFKYLLNRNNMTSITMTVDEIEDMFSPPPSVRGMKVLDRKLFLKKVTVPSVSVPIDIVSAVKKKLKKFMLRIPNLQPILDDDGGKMILLHPSPINTDPQFAEMVTKLQLELKQVDINLTYENWGYSSIVKAVLPQNLQFNVTSYSIIGHIIHLNLKEDVIEYKTLIAEVILDKVPVAKTVVNKTKAINDVYRNFSMEVLAGEPDFQVTVKENGLKYEMDFSKVFWNPRLGHEHDEIVKRMNAGDIVFDVFAGIGPFAIPAAKKKCIVYANDLNPDSYKWLCHNSHLNKVDKFLTAYNLDGNDFIYSVVKDKLTDLYRQGSGVQTHILMNLPASAVTFLNSFKYLLDDFDDPPAVTSPIVYCYFFASKQLTEESVIEQYLDSDLQKNIKEITPVRNIAPKKKMVRVVFSIPRTFLFQDTCAKPKRLKLDDC